MVVSTAEPRVRNRLTEQDWHVSNTTSALPYRATLTGTRPGRRVDRFAFEGGELVIVVEGDPPLWLEPTVRSLGELLQLKPNWDSYGAQPVDSHCVAAALQLALDTLRDNTPAPSVVPTSRGGLQLEWHTRGLDLEVEFLSATRICGLFEDRVGNEGWEEDLTFDRGPLVRAISVLSEIR